MMTMGVRPNTLLPHLKGLLAKLSRERALTRNLARRVGLKYEDTEQSVVAPVRRKPAKGGVFARGIDRKQPRLLLLDEPTRGVDIVRKIRDLRLDAPRSALMACGYDHGLQRSARSFGHV